MDAFGVARQIASEYAGEPDDLRLPSEQQLAHHLGVSRATVRGALKILADRHVVRRVHGAGTFINRPFTYRMTRKSPPSLIGTVTGAGGQVRVNLRVLTQEPAGAEVANALGCSTGDIAVHLSRLFWVNERIAVCSDVWLRSDILAEPIVALRTVASVYEVLQMAGFQPERTTTRVSTAFPPAEIEHALELEKPTSVWSVQGIACDAASEEPLTFSHMWMRPDAISVVVEW